MPSEMILLLMRSTLATSVVLRLRAHVVVGRRDGMLYARERKDRQSRVSTLSYPAGPGAECSAQGRQQNLM